MIRLEYIQSKGNKFNAISLHTIQLQDSFYHNISSCLGWSFLHVSRHADQALGYYSPIMTNRNIQHMSLEGKVSNLYLTLTIK